LTSDDFVRVGILVIGSEGDERSIADGVCGIDWSKSQLLISLNEEEGDTHLEMGEHCHSHLDSKREKVVQTKHKPQRKQLYP
jgi:hypothetical protein